MLRFALHAQQGAGFFRRKIEHLRGLRDCFRKLELAFVDALHVFVPSGASSAPTLGWRAKRLQMNVFDACFREREPERGLREAGASREWQRSDVDDPLDARFLKRANEFRDRRAFVADGEDAHRRWIARKLGTNSSA